jgi:hypothetical protein
MTFSILLIVLLPVALLCVLLLFVIVNRYIRYKERIGLAQLGYSLEELGREEAEASRGNRGVLWGGVITAMSGLALLVGLGTLGLGVWLIGGLLPLFVGLGMVVIYFMTLGTTPNKTPGLAGDGGGDNDNASEQRRLEDPAPQHDFDGRT